MTAEAFAYWLQGFFELSGATHLDERQTQIVRDHLALLFEKKTPERAVLPADIQKVLEQVKPVTETAPAPLTFPIMPTAVPTTRPWREGPPFERIQITCSDIDVTDRMGGRSFC